MTITPSQAAFLELRGEGAFSQTGKSIQFHDSAGRLVFRLWAKTSKDAAQQLRIFRAAPKYLQG